jgi:hypothetical protein
MGAVYTVTWQATVQAPGMREAGCEALALLKGHLSGAITFDIHPASESPSAEPAGTVQVRAKRYAVRWETTVETVSPLSAARYALAMQRNPEGSATAFEVAEEGQAPALIDLGSQNPLGRPPCSLINDDVCCGHCRSANTRYIETVSQYAPIWIRFENVYANSAELEADDDGVDPRVWCADCGLESELPDSFTWA